MGYSPALITSSTSCTRSARSCIGTWARAWKKENFPRHAKTWQHLKKTTKRLASKLPRARRRAMATSSEQTVQPQLCRCRPNRVGLHALIGSEGNLERPNQRTASIVSPLHVTIAKQKNKK